MDASASVEILRDSKTLSLACKTSFYKENILKKIDEEENLWKLCIWTRNSDKTSCSIKAIDNWVTEIDKCDSSISTRPSGVDIMGNDRRVCEILINNPLPMDHGRWTCRMEKCKTVKEGGCAYKDSSSCFGERTVYAEVLN